MPGFSGLEILRDFFGNSGLAGLNWEMVRSGLFEEQLKLARQAATSSQGKEAPTDPLPMIKKTLPIGPPIPAPTPERKNAPGRDENVHNSGEEVERNSPVPSPSSLSPTEKTAAPVAQPEEKSPLDNERASPEEEKALPYAEEEVPPQTAVPESGVPGSPNPADLWEPASEVTLESSSPSQEPSVPINEKLPSGNNGNNCNNIEAFSSTNPEQKTGLETVTRHETIRLVNTVEQVENPAAVAPDEAEVHQTVYSEEESVSGRQGANESNPRCFPEATRQSIPISGPEVLEAEVRGVSWVGGEESGPGRREVFGPTGVAETNIQLQVTSTNPGPSQPAKQTNPPNPLGGIVPLAAVGLINKVSNAEIAVSGSKGSGATSLQSAQMGRIEASTKTSPTAIESANSSALASGGRGVFSAARYSGKQGIETSSQEANVQRVRFIQRVVRAFQALRDGGGTVRLRLHPPELGSLRVELLVREGVLRARMEVETSAARAAILEHLPILRERLAQQDIRIEQFDVEIGEDTVGSDSQQPDNSTPGQRSPVFWPSTSRPRPSDTASSTSRVNSVAASDSSKLNVLI
ncbi:MAG: flagellar hook-length control protein FliK [Thermoguttaceae bacterium]|nr:flagellar hook-length control protein FliK [Thermoguttaceae bacterium]MDW8037265.1 flagellar hook-length control protein FliK [Thermoguttaceae bacterium]